MATLVPPPIVGDGQPEYYNQYKYTKAPGPNTTGLLETLFIYIFSRLAQASVQALYNLSSSPVVLGPGCNLNVEDDFVLDPQVLLRLCGHKSAVEELARKDDLTLLFSAISSVCPKHNVIWRKTSGDVLLTISRYSLSQPVISYLHNKERSHKLSHKYSPKAYNLKNILLGVFFGK